MSSEPLPDKHIAEGWRLGWRHAFLLAFVIIGLMHVTGILEFIRGVLWWSFG